MDELVPWEWLLRYPGGNRHRRRLCCTPLLLNWSEIHLLRLGAARKHQDVREWLLLWLSCQKRGASLWKDGGAGDLPVVSVETRPSIELTPDSML